MTYEQILALLESYRPPESERTNHPDDACGRARNALLDEIIEELDGMTCCDWRTCG
jgi:hypothetical protein